MERGIALSFFMSRENNGPIAVNTDVTVLRETPDWIAVDKPAPLLVHPTNETNERTLWHTLNELLMFELATGGQLSLINRLDRETSGITLAAKTSSAARALGKAMQAKLFRKEYLALIYGHPSWKSLVVDEPILRQGDVCGSRIWVRQCVHPEGKPSRTEFEVVEKLTRLDRMFSLVKCRPETGRMHQIRVHLSYAGYPVVGDKIYGPSEECYLKHMERGWSSELADILWLPRQALHASGLTFPWKEEEITISSPLPRDWGLLL